MLFGRTAEHARITELLDDARDGRGGVLVLCGDAAVLDAVRRRIFGLPAPGSRVS